MPRFERGRAIRSRENVHNQKRMKINTHADRYSHKNVGDPVPYLASWRMTWYRGKARQHHGNPFIIVYRTTWLLGMISVGWTIITPTYTRNRQTRSRGRVTVTWYSQLCAPRLPRSESSSDRKSRTEMKLAPCRKFFAWIETEIISVTLLDFDQIACVKLDTRYWYISDTRNEDWRLRAGDQYSIDRKSIEIEVTSGWSSLNL